MKVSVSYAEIWRISWPIMLGSLANTIINFTDVAFVSRVGEKELAASALGGVFYFLLVMTGMAFAVGSQILIARREGEGRKPDSGVIFDNSLVLLSLFAFFSVLLVYSILPKLIGLLVSDHLVAQATVTYLQARGWGIVFMMLLVALRAFYTGIALTRMITFANVVMMLLNVLFNYLLVPGNWGIPPMGIAGSGLASALAESSAALMMLLATIFNSRLRDYGLFRFVAIKRSEIAVLIELSLPIMLQHLLSMGSWFFFFLMIEKLGSRELAVSNVVRSIYMVLMTPVWGISQAANSMVSNLIGQDRQDEVMVLAGKLVRLSLLIGLITIMLGFLFRDPLFSLSSADAALRQDALPGYYVISVATVFFSMAMILLSSVSGTGSTAASMRIEVVSLVVYVLYIIAFTIVWPMSAEVVWGSEVCYWILLGVFSYRYLSSSRWRSIAARYN